MNILCTANKLALLLGNDKNSVVADKVLSYFECLSSKFEVYVKHFGD